VTGTVASVTSTSLTVTTSTGTTVTVDFSATTSVVGSNGPSTTSNITTGERVAVFGTTTDGVVDATVICLDPPSGPPSGSGSASASASSGPPPAGGSAPAGGYGSGSESSSATH